MGYISFFHRTKLSKETEEFKERRTTYISMYLYWNSPHINFFHVWALFSSVSVFTLFIFYFFRVGLCFFFSFPIFHSLLLQSSAYFYMPFIPTDLSIFYTYRPMYRPAIFTQCRSSLGKKGIELRHVVVINKIQYIDLNKSTFVDVFVLLCYELHILNVFGLNFINYISKFSAAGMLEFWF